MVQGICLWDLSSLQFLYFAVSCVFVFPGAVELSSSAGTAESLASEPHSFEDHSTEDGVTAREGPGSASATLKPGSQPAEYSLDEASSLEKEFAGMYLGSSATSSDGSVLSSGSEQAHSNPATRTNSLALGESAMPASKSMDFNVERSSTPNSRFNFDLNEVPDQRKNVRSVISLDKVRLFHSLFSQKSPPFSLVNSFNFSLSSIR